MDNQTNITGIDPLKKIHRGQDILDGWKIRFVWVTMILVTCGWITGCATNMVTSVTSNAPSAAGSSLGVQGPSGVTVGTVGRYSVTNSLPSGTTVSWSLQGSELLANSGSISMDGIYTAPSSLPSNPAFSIVASAPSFTSVAFPVTLRNADVPVLTYYVDSVGGEDTNAGTSSNSPWKTITKVNATMFKPGDSVLFKRGDTWKQTLVVPSSGTPALPITFGAYGSGNAPVIDTSVVETSWTIQNEGSFNVYYTTVASEPYVVTEDGSFVWGSFPLNASLTSTFNPLNEMVPGQFVWDSTHSRVYVRLLNEESPTAHTMEVGQNLFTILVDGKTDIRLENLQLSGANYDCIRAENQADDLQIVDNTVINCGYEGNQGAIFIDGARYAFIQGNTISYAGNMAINLSGYDGGISDNGVITNNQISYTGYDCIQFGPTLTGSVAQGLAQYNDVSHCGQTRLDSAGIDSYLPGQGIIYRYNQVHQSGTSVSYSAGLRFDSGSEYEKAYGNLVYLNSSGCVQFGGSNLSFYNNTCYQNNELAAYNYGEMNFFVSSATGAPTYVQAFNNILVPSAGMLVVKVNDDATAYQTINTNLYGTDTTSKLYMWGGIAYDYAEWKVASGQDLGSPTPGNPEFSNAAAYNFTLMPLSPALNIGEPTGDYLTDILGTAVPQLLGILKPDLGCYEVLS
jgi:hypothetical protein